MKKKILSMVIMLTMVLGVVGCSSNDKVKNELSGNEQFVQTFQESINKRWKKQAELSERYKTDTTLTSEQYAEESMKILEEELAALEAKEVNVEEKDLQSHARNYIEGVKNEIEAKKTTDYEAQNKYIKESDKLRKPAIVGLVEDYGIKIDAENEQIYNDLKEEAKTIKKEIKSQKYADDLARKIEFQKTTDAYGNVSITATVENKSKFNFKNLSYNVEYKNQEKTVIGNETIYLSNFNAGTKQQIRLSHFDENAKFISITTSGFEIE